MFTDYYDEGFLALQHAVDEGIIYQLNTSADQDNVMVLLQRYPYPPYVQDAFVSALQSYLPLILLLSFIVTAPSIVKDIVIEKESRLKVCKGQKEFTRCNQKYYISVTWNHFF